MNKKRREELGRAEHYINMARDIVQSAMDDEQFSLFNIPENLQCTDQYDKMEDAVDSLSDAIESLDDAKEQIGSAKE